MQHSLWVAEIVNSNFDEATSTCLLNVNPMGVLPRHVSFRRIWQGKGAQAAACKVATVTVFWLLLVSCVFD